MKNKMKTLLGVAVIGVLLSVAGTQPAVATALRTLVLTTLTATTGTITTLSGTTGSIASLTASTLFRGPVPTAQTIGAGGTIAADACGGIKQITSASDVTTDTTNTFTAPSTAGTCDMLILNVGVHQVLLDANTLFPLPGGIASLRLDSGGSVRVWSNGTTWYHGNATEY